MQPIRDPNVVTLIERIGEHYRANIANRFIRPALLQLSLDKMTWDNIDTLMEKAEQFKYQGFQIEELYRQIAAAARFVSAARRDFSTSLKSRVSAGANGADRVLRDMAVNAFSSNVRVLGELLNELYLCLVELDKAAAKGRKPIYAQIPDLADINTQLLG